MEYTSQVSVGMPVFNGERYLCEAIDSIRAQTYKDFELIISDNASTDSTEDICRHYAAIDSRIKYRRNERNIGAALNYNAVFDRSHGKYFKWASANDLCSTNFLERCSEVLNSRNDAVLCYPKTKLLESHFAECVDYIDNLDLQEEKPYLRYILFMQNIRLNNIMNGLIRSATLKKTRLNKNFPGSDICLMAELSLHGKFVEVPGAFFFRRMDKHSSSKFKSKNELYKYFDPSCRDKIQMIEWQAIYANICGVINAPISVGEKCKIIYYLLRRGVVNRVVLGEELIFFLGSHGNKALRRSRNRSTENK